jgi:hypothetical protein
MTFWIVVTTLVVLALILRIKPTKISRAGWIYGSQSD